jgi:transposase
LVLAICLDKFYVVGYFNKAADEVRKRENSQLLKQNDSRLKGTKYEWLKGESNVDNRTRKWFTALKHSTLKTARAWGIKETARALWNFKYIGAAERGWKHLMSWMCRSQLTPMRKLYKSIKRHLWAILNTVRLRVSNGYAESNNARIQEIKKLACGFRNARNFKYAIYFHCGELDMSPVV